MKKAPRIVSLLVTLAFVISLPLMAIAGYKESGTTSCGPGKILQTRVYATGVEHWHWVDTSYVVKINSHSGWHITYEAWGPYTSSTYYALGHSEEGPAPQFSYSGSYPYCS